MAAGESFFSSLLSGRHESQRDETGAYFIDREWRSARALLIIIKKQIFLSYCICNLFPPSIPLIPFQLELVEWNGIVE